MLAWGFLLLGFGSISKDTTAFMVVLPSPHFDLLAETPQVGLAHGLCGESGQEGPGELEAEREDFFPGGVQAEMLLLFPSSWCRGPHPPPQKESHQEGKKGDSPGCCSARTHVETQGRTPGCLPAP